MPPVKLKPASDSNTLPLRSSKVKYDKSCLAQGHKTVPPVKFKPASDSNTLPLSSSIIKVKYDKSYLLQIFFQFKVIDELVTELTHCVGMHPVVIWWISVTFLYHQYKPVIYRTNIT